MTHVNLGFKAFDIHELLCHFVAQRGGFYRQQALQVGLIDTTFIPDDKLPPRTFHAACGAALFGYVNGAPNKVLLVNTDRPMFWLHAANGVNSVAELAGKRIASYPGMAPPAHFLAMIAANTDVQLLPVSTDAARLGMLRSGDVDAALISAALPPAVMAQNGFSNALLLGDEFRAPTTGLAINSELLEKEAKLVAGMVKAHQQSLAAIHSDDALLKAVLTGDLGLPASAVEETVRLVRGLFTRDGRSNAAVQQRAIAAVAARLGVENLPMDPLYHYDLLTP
jgi:ABC-type nitrate/sulfonate/bicarbonate transport system substrate-binding protein